MALAANAPRIFFFGTITEWRDGVPNTSVALDFDDRHAPHPEQHVSRGDTADDREDSAFKLAVRHGRCVQPPNTHQSIGDERYELGKIRA